MTGIDSHARPIPRYGHFDATLAMLRDPYNFISSTCDALGTDVFEARILLRKTILMRGADAAQLICDEDRFTRKGAAPGALQKTLFGRGGVQGLDGPDHRHRKAMFLSFAAPERVDDIARLVLESCREYARRWERASEVSIYEEFRHFLTRSACAWAGVPLGDPDVDDVKDLLTALFDKAGSKGPGHLYSRLQRKRAHSWAVSIIKKIRGRDNQDIENTIVGTIASHRERDGQLLSPRAAGVELLNVLRPTVAVSVFLVFIVHALERYPELRQRISDEPAFKRAFVEEVRRLYPFFPSVVARIQRQFEWNGYDFPRGPRVMLDLHGTSRDSRSWVQPETFDPLRIRDGAVTPYNLIPQGPGDHLVNHRCPGETITIVIMETVTSFLLDELRYQVGELSAVDEKRLPALPRPPLMLRDVRLLAG